MIGVALAAQVRPDASTWALRLEIDNGGHRFDHEKTLDFCGSHGGCCDILF